MDFPRKAEFITGSRGGLVLLFDTYQYHRREMRGRKTIWVCTQTRRAYCPGKAVTEDDLLTSVSGIHTCDKPPYMVNNSTNHAAENSLHDTNQAPASEEVDKLIIKLPRGKRKSIMSVENQNYLCRTRRGDSVYWGCTESGCNARVVTKNGSVKSTIGTHICCISSEKIGEEDHNTKESDHLKSHLPPTTKDKWLIVSDCVTAKPISAEFRANNYGSTSLYIDNVRYTCTNRVSDVKRIYWKCSRTFCRARAVTLGDCLMGLSGVHICNSQNLMLKPKDKQPYKESYVEISSNYSTPNMKMDSTGGANNDFLERPTSSFNFKTLTEHEEIQIQNQVEAHNQDSAHKQSEELNANEIYKEKSCALFQANMNDQQSLYINNQRYSCDGTKINTHRRCCCSKCQAEVAINGDILMSTSRKHICQSNDKEVENVGDIGLAIYGEDNVWNATCNGENSEQFSQSFNDTTNSEKTVGSVYVDLASAHENHEPPNEAVSFVKSERGKTLLAINSRRYKCTNHLSGIGKSYWKCVCLRCPARAITLGKHLHSMYGIHVCESAPLESNKPKNKPPRSEKNKQFSDISFSFIAGKRGNKLLVVDNRVFKLAKNVQAVKKSYWLCARLGCPARAVTVGGCLKNMTGTHTCTSEEHESKLSNAGPKESYLQLNFVVGNRGTNHLLLDNRKYRRKNTAATTDKTYWECIRADGGCRAKVITQAGRLIRSHTAHSCGAALTPEKEHKENVMKEGFPGMKRERFTETPCNVDLDKPPAKKRKILRQKNIFEAFSANKRAKNLEENKQIETIAETIAEIAEIPNPSSGSNEEAAKKKVRKVKSQTRRIQRKKVKPLTATRRVVSSQKRAKKKTTQQSYTDLEEVKRMPHLQPRVLVARFLTAAIEKLSERMKLIQELSVEADKVLSVNTVSIANLSLND